MTAAERHPERLSAEDVDELVRGYQRVSSHLSTARTVYMDPPLSARLTALVGRAHAVVYGTRPRTWSAIVGFVMEVFPAAVWHLRRPILAATALFTVTAVAVGTWVALSPSAAAAVAPPEVLRRYIEQDFAGYYSAQPAGQFAALVFTNNARVGIVAFATGIAFCVPTALVLLVNGANIGVAGGLFHAAGEAPLFYGLILPHGLLELTAVFVAGGTGLHLGWTLIAPGDRTRGEAVAEEGQRAIVVVIGLVGVFLAAGLIEALVTPSGLPTAARVAIGVVALLAFLGHVIVRGPAAARRGLTGALGEARPHSRPTALRSR